MEEIRCDDRISIGLHKMFRTGEESELIDDGKTANLRRLRQFKGINFSVW